MIIRRAIEELGVREFCVCAGSRNAPLLAEIAATPVRSFSFVDERSAAFFALGRIKLHGEPVAVVTTSGTAAAELLPAAVESYYSGLPLVLITADRPARYRGTGAPQCIEQEGIFGKYAWVHWNVEVENDGTVFGGAAGASPAVGRRGGGTSTEIRFAAPLVIVGGLAAKHRERVREFVQKLNAPVYAEALSGIRGTITSGERMIGRGSFDGVIRIGNVPTLRFWRDLDESRTELPVMHFSDLEFPGLTRGEVHPIEALPQVRRREGDAAFDEEDQRRAQRWHQILDEEPQSELSLLRDLERNLPHDARVYLGNSLPIREWDLVSTRTFEVQANRGANGIDGQLSTFLGWCAPGATNVAVVGDLTALYDLNAPWIVPQLDADFRIAIINNRGGRIFERVPSLRHVDKKLVINEHAIRFDKWAEMFGIAVTELRPDEAATRRVWQRYDELWS